jgi:hypothetical protein
LKPIPPQPLTDPEGLSLRAAGAEELVEVLALGELAALLPLRLELLALAAHLVHVTHGRAQEASGQSSTPLILVILVIPRSL